jgi:hypothetical protein
MPAERSRGSRRCGNDGNQLVWTNPIEPTASSGFSFATNLTPITFNDPPSSPSFEIFDPSAPEPLFPPSESPSRSGPAHSKRKPDNHIPRPPNAFILFRSSFIKSQHVSTEVETNHSTLSKIIGLTWQNLPDTERQVWHAKAKAKLDEHKRKFPEYAFRPVHAKSKPAAEREKRKVREVGVKDMKRCAKIAELLVEGKKGAELDAAIQEFDKSHVPEIVTRFEEPITARAYRRPSSAPPPEAPSGPFLHSFPSTPTKPKHRASSSKPKSPAPLQRCASLETFGEFSFPPKSEPSSSPPPFDYAESPSFYSQDGSVDPLSTFVSSSSDSYASSPLAFEAIHDPFSMPSSSPAMYSTPATPISPSPTYGASFVDASYPNDSHQMPPLVDIPPDFPESFSYSAPYAHPEVGFAQKVSHAGFYPYFMDASCPPSSAIDLPACNIQTNFLSGCQSSQVVQPHSATFFDNCSDFQFQGEAYFTSILSGYDPVVV